MMKNIGIFIFVLLFLTKINGQIGIEVAAVRGSGIMDFPSGINKGIIIPILDSNLNSNASPGTIRMYQSMIQGITNSGIVNFSGVGDTTGVIFNNSDSVPVGVNSLIVGSNTSTVNGGALILESADKALILPHVTNVVNMPSPYPGTICYDENSKSFAIFDGKVWNFWK